MRFLAVTPYYTPEGGGLERYAHEILSRLVARGHQVEVVTCTRDETRAERLDDVTVHRRHTRIRLGNTPIDPWFRRRVTARIRSFRPDVVVAHTPVPFPAEMAYQAARRAGVPFVTTYHAGRLRGSSWLLDVFARLDRATLERRMLAGSSRLIAVTSFVRDHALARFRDKVVIIPPGVDVDRFRPGGPVDEDTVLFVGPLSSSYRWKGVDVLWEAFEKVRADRPRARLALVGDGDRTTEFAARAATMDGAVRLYGRLPEPGLVSAYQHATVVVLPSVTDAESFGMVLAEANACGRPVVASDVGGIPCYVRHGENGLLAVAGDAEDLAEKIRMLLDDRHRADKLGENGRLHVLERHDWDHLADVTEAVLQEAAGVRDKTGAADPAAEDPEHVAGSGLPLRHAQAALPRSSGRSL